MIRLLLLCLALPAAGQSLDTILDQGREIPPDEWRGMVQGRTVTYARGGVFWGLEAYDKAGPGVRFQLQDGSCEDGLWRYDAPAYCFDWPGQTDCFRHIELAGTIYVVGMVGDTPVADISVVSDISDAPLACGPALIG